jgi:hypothetical protein
MNIGARGGKIKQRERGKRIQMKTQYTGTNFFKRPIAKGCYECQTAEQRQTDIKRETKLKRVLPVTSRQQHQPKHAIDN